MCACDFYFWHTFTHTGTELHSDYEIIFCSHFQLQQKNVGKKMTSRKNQQKQQSTHIHHFFVSGKLHTQANTHTYTTHLIWNEKSYTTSQFASIFHFLIFGVFNEIFHWPICSLCALFYKTYKKRENEQKKMTTRTNLSPFFYLYSHGITRTHTRHVFLIYREKNYAQNHCFFNWISIFRYKILLLVLRTTNETPNSIWKTYAKMFFGYMSCEWKSGSNYYVSN